MKAEVGKRYRHYKGYEYEVIAIGRDEETLLEVVVYQAQYDTPDFGPNPIWVRPRVQFEETTMDQAGNTVERFTVIE